jgi:SnoaL-like domain
MSLPTDTAVARDAIRDLVAAYAHAADQGRFDDLVALFAPEGVLELEDGRQLRGRAAIGDFLREVAAAGAAAPGARILRHHVSSHHVISDGPNAAHGWAYFVVFTERGPDHWGRYRDAYVHAGGAWRFASRHVRVEGRRAESSPAS